MNSTQPLRAVRSFVVRAGRMTPSQEKALSTYWPRFGLEPENGPPDLQHLFPQSRRCVLEIGFGMGDSLLAMAQAQPETGFIGVEVHRPGVGRLLNNAAKVDLQNLRVYCADALDVLGHCISADSLDGVLLFFPDPWPKKKHHKRRIVQPDFVEAVRTRLKPGGVLHMATDWEPYAEHMLAVMAAAPGYRNQAGEGEFSSPGERPHTKFQRRGEKLGHRVSDLVFERVD